MAKTRKKQIEIDITEQSTSKTDNDLEAPELKPISVWAQQIKDKLKVPLGTESLPDPLAAIVKENTVAKMARVLKEKMQAFNAEPNGSDPLVTTCVDSSEVTFPSPVPSLDTILVKPSLEVVSSLPVLGLREKFGHTYQRSYPPPKKRKHDEEDSEEEEESTTGIRLWLENQVDEAKKEQTDSVESKVDGEETNTKRNKTKARRKNVSSSAKEVRKEPPKQQATANSLKKKKKDKDNLKKVTKKPAAKKGKTVVVKRKLSKKRKAKM